VWRKKNSTIFLCASNALRLPHENIATKNPIGKNLSERKKKKLQFT